MDVAGNGVDGLALARGGGYDAAVIDRMLPRLDGLALVRTLRQERVALPILLLTALAETRERVDGAWRRAPTTTSASPSPSPMHARACRRWRDIRRWPGGTLLRAGDLEMVPAAPRCHAPPPHRAAGTRVPAAGTCCATSIAVTPRLLLEHVWEFHFDPKTSVVETTSTACARKVDRGHAQELIQTVRGVGYCLRAPDD